MDLGTARGKVKVDADTKGVKGAEKDLGKLDAALRIVGKAAKVFEDGLNKMERELKDASKEMRDADRAADDLGGSIRSADKDTLNWTRDLKGLQERLKGVNQTAKNVGPPLLQIAKIGTEFRRTNGGIIGFAQAFTRAGATATIISTIRSNFLGMSAAMATLPAGQKKVVQLANSFRLLTYGVGIATALAVKTGVLGGVYETVFRKIVKHSEYGGKAFMAMEKRLKPFIPALQRATKYIGELNTAVDKIPAGLVQTITGFAMMRNGLKGLATRLQFITRMSPKMLAIVGTAFASLPALIEGGAVALRGFSNALMLVLDAGKQLAGGFLAIPAAITMMITGIGTLKVLFKGLATAFEDLFKAKTAEEFAAALEALPEHLKPLGKVFAELIPQWKALSADMQKTFVIGAAEQIKALSNTYLPALHNGILPLVNTFREVKNALAGFLAQGQTVSFIKAAFQATNQTVLNLKDAMVPLLEGFRDIASVGLAFIRNMSDGAQGVTERFAEWARINRENGNLMRWMEEAVQGVKDLWSGLKDASKALWTLLTLFATDTGDNALERFADAMKKFNDAVQKSAAEGILKQIGDAVKGMKTEKIEQLWDVFKHLGDALKEVIPFVVEVSSSFGDVFFPALKQTIDTIKIFADILDTLGLDSFLGTVIGLVGAFKMMNAIGFGPLRNIIQTLVGAFNGFKGSKKIIEGVTGALEKLGPKGEAASEKIKGAGDTIKTIFGAAGIAASIGVAFYTFYQEGAQQIDNMKDKVTELRDFTENMGQEIASNIIDEGTLKNQKEIFNNAIDEMRTKLQEAADAAPGFAGKFVDAMRAQTEAGGAPIEMGVDQGIVAPRTDVAVHTEGFDELSELQENAKAADEAIDHLGLTTEGLNDKVMGTRAGFDQFIADVKASGEGGEQAAAYFETLREEYEALQRVGEGGIQIAHGIDEIADSAGDAASKLSGLETALRGAGLLQSDAMDAAFNYAESIREITTANESLADTSQPLDDILDKTTGSYNYASVNAANLHNQIRDLEEEYRRNVANGADARVEWEKQGPALQKLADDFGLTRQQVEALAAAEGGVPTEIALLMSVEGADEVKQDVIDTLLAVKTAAKDQPVTIPIEGDPAQVKQMVESLLGPGSVIAQTDGTITISANIDPGTINNALAVLTAAGITVPGQPAPSVPLTADIQPKIVEPDRKGLKEPVTGPAAAPTEGVVVEAGPAAKPPEVAVSPADQATLDTAKTTLDEIKTKTEALNQLKVEIKINADPLNELTGSIDEITRSLAEKKLTLEVELKGMEEFQTGMDVIKTTIANSVTQWNNYKIAVVQVFRDIVSAFGTAMAELTAKMNEAGSQNLAAGQKFGNDFAQGIRNSIPEIAAAADLAAQTAADRMPHSPAKKGPLSGRGWSGYAGKSFAEDFAEGIANAAGSVGAESDAMAERATASMAGRDESFQTFLSGLIRVLDIASTALGVVQSVFDHISEVYKISEDIRKGPEERAGDRERGAEAVRTRREGGAGVRGLPGAEGLRGVTDPSKEQIAAAIIGEAQKRGYGRDVAIGAIATGMLESGLNSVIENATGHKGIFQMDRAKPGRDTALGQITWFFDQLDSLNAKEAADPLDLIANQIEKGGYGGEAISQFTPEAAQYYDDLTAALGENSRSTLSNVDASSELRSDLTVTGRKGLQPAAENLLQIVSEAFPEVSEIGGKRPDSKPYHPAGRALDIMIGKNMELGDEINAFLREHADQLGIESTIWRNTFRDMEGNISTVAGHMDHIHAQLIDGTENFSTFLRGVPGLGEGAGITLSDESANNFADEVSSRDLSVYDGTNEQVNAAYAKVDEAANNDIIDELRANNTTLDESIDAGSDPTTTDEEQLQALSNIENEITTLGGVSGTENQEQVAALGEVKNTISQAREERAGLAAQEQAGAATGDAFGTVMQTAGQVMAIAQDIIGLAKTAIETIGYVKASMDLLVRGVENTEQINVFIDTIQKFIEMGAKVAQTISDITGMASGLAGGADFGGLAAASAIAGAISGILTTVNAVIDMAQEAWHIFGSYFGQFLGFLAGAGDQIEGDTRFLLDQNDKTLKAYGRNNPMDKASHPYGQEVGGFLANERDQQPQIGSITVFGGPNQDPRETTRNMMFAVKTSTMGSTYAQ